MDETKQPQPVETRVEARTVSLYPSDWEVIRKVARRLEGNNSFALRRIIRAWDSDNGGSDGSESDKSE